MVVSIKISLNYIYIVFELFASTPIPSHYLFILFYFLVSMDIFRSIASTESLVAYSWWEELKKACPF